MFDKMFDKALFYDWLGANDVLFKGINSLHGETYDMIMVLLSKLADSHNFPYYVLIMVLWALARYAGRKLSSHGGNAPYLSIWFGIIAVFIVGFGAEIATVKLLKEEFAYPRPYLVYPVKDIHVIDYKYEPENDHHSFPSGHVAFITLFVMSLWPRLSADQKLLGLLLIFAVGWSRIAMGMHFPADVLGAFLLVTFIVIIVRALMYRTLRKFGITC